MLFFAKIIGSYNALENPLTTNLNDIGLRIRNIISVQGQNTPKPVPVQEQNQRSGLFKLTPLDFFCYFKNFYPIGLKIEQNVGLDCYNSLFTYITVKDRQGLDCVEPLFRKTKKGVEEVSAHLAKNNYVELKLELKVKVLERIKYQMFKMPTIDSLMQIANPLGKSILRDLNNYELVDVTYL